MKKKEELPKSIQDQLVEVDALSDRLGMPVDEGIKLLVAALRAHGLVTTDSCEGHEDRRTNGPRVSLMARENVGLNDELFKLPYDGEEARQLRETMRGNGYRARSVLLNLLDDFYGKREVSEWVRVILELRGANGSFVLVCQGASTVDAIQPDDRRLAWLKLAQQEFADFADFLVERISK